MAALCELAFRQVPRYNSRSDGRFPESSSGGSWPAGLSAHRQLPGIGTQRQQFGGELVGINACSVPFADLDGWRKRTLRNVHNEGRALPLHASLSIVRLGVLVGLANTRCTYLSVECDENA